MKRFFKLYIGIIIIPIFLCSCGEININTPPNTNGIYNEKSTNLYTQKIPQYVNNIYERIQKTIIENNFDIISTKVSSGENKESYLSYSFELVDPSTNEGGMITFGGDTEHGIDEKFEYTLSDDIAPSILKSQIICIILSINDETYEDAKKLTNKLVAEFDGKKQTKEFKVGNYFIFIQPGDSLLDAKLHVVCKNYRNKKIDTSKYLKFSSKEMRAELNLGELAYISGTIKKIKATQFYNYLVIENKKEKYLVYYNPDNFVGIFKKGIIGTFYGEISGNKDGYSGSVRADYFKISK